METRKKKSLMLLAALAVGSLLLPVYSKNQTQDTDNGYYALGCSQITIGASSGDSSTYDIEDNLKVATCAGPAQASDSYSVDDLGSVGPLANNGLASGQGTTMMLCWPDARQILGIKGYEIYRSRSSDPESFARINADLVSITQYRDEGLQNGVYFYRIHFVNSADQSIQWTPSFSGEIRSTLAVGWMLY